MFMQARSASKGMRFASRQWVADSLAGASGLDDASLSGKPEAQARDRAVLLIPSVVTVKP